MSKTRDWAVASDNNLRIWMVLIWFGLVVTLVLVAGCTIRFIMKPEWITGIPSFAVFIFWAYLLVDGRRP